MQKNCFTPVRPRCIDGLGQESLLLSSLQALLDLDEHSKDARGVRHTPREIFQQPRTWLQTYDHCLERKPEIEDYLRSAGVGRQDLSPIVLLVGAGSSDYVGRALVHLLRRCWHSEVYAVPSTDLLVDLDSYLLPDRRQLWLSFSRSGDSPEGVTVLERSLGAHSQIRHLVVTCNSEAAMVRVAGENADRVFSLVLSDEVNDRGLAMTSSFTNMIVAGQFLAQIQEVQSYGETLRCMAKISNKILQDAAALSATIAEKGFSKACFVGSNSLAAVASESALKLLELTSGRIQTMAQSTLGLRHGPMSSIDNNTLFVQFLSSDQRVRRYELDLLDEIGRKKLAGLRVVVSPQRLELDRLADHALLLDVPETFPDDCRPPVDVITGQLLGLFASLKAGLHPDSPSPSGAISRVVSGVKIYS
jgi:tagatose-6-phosphate ketose/aldose isomerase